jgi:hypothetical protein
MLPLWVFRRIPIFFKTHKNLCTTLKRLIKTEYGLHGDKNMDFMHVFYHGQTFFDKTKD